MPETYHIQLINAEYDCGYCNSVHRYTNGEVYELHMDLRVGVKRWVYEEREAGA